MKKTAIYLLGIMILGAVLRLFQLNIRPFDGDEGIVIKVAQNNWFDLIRQASLDVHPPLINILIKPIIDSLGVSEWTMRLLPALLGILFIYLVYIFAHKLLENKKLALITAAMTAISAYLIYPSQEIRMYMLFAVLSLTSYYFFYALIWLILNNKQIHWRYWVFYTIFSTLMIYTQYLGFVVLISQLGYLIYLGWQTKFKHCGQNRLKWFFSWLIIMVLFLPQFKIMIAQFMARVSEQPQSLSFMDNSKGLLGAFYRFGSGRLFLDLDPSSIKTMLVSNPWLFLVFILTLLIPLIIFGQGMVIAYKKYSQQFWFMTFSIILAMLLAIFSQEIGSRANRYLIYILPFYLIFITLGIDYYWPKKLGKFLVIGFITINLLGLYRHYNWENKAPGVNKIAQFINQNYLDGNTAVLMRGGFGGGEEWVFRYYWQRLAISDKPLAVYDMIGGYEKGNLAQLKAIRPEDKIKELLNKYDKVLFYDMTYSNYQIEGIKHNLGKDKENKDLVMWEINN